MNTTTSRTITAIAVTVLTVSLAACAPSFSTNGSSNDSPGTERSSFFDRSVVSNGSAGQGGSSEDSATGAIPDGTIVDPNDLSHPGVANLDSDLRQAVIQASQAAEEQDIEFGITSGWRSADYQQKLLDDAVAKYGSKEEASKWVLTPEASNHVKGAAVDIGHTDGADWLDRNGEQWGLCRTYENELWHFELATTPGGTCPTMVSDASAEGSGS